jgi:hypothetical protein
MAIDWQTMMEAFVITWPDGGAIILIPSTVTGKPGIQAAISFDKIRGFTLREVPETEYAEVILEVNYEPSEKCLGLTKQVEEAKKWVTDANKLLNNVRKRKSSFEE